LALCLSVQEVYSGCCTDIYLQFERHSPPAGPPPAIGHAVKAGLSNPCPVERMTLSAKELYVGFDV
jgi:hypothetical protein